MNERPYLMVCVCILIAAIVILAYVAVVIYQEYKLTRIDLNVCKSALRNHRELITKLCEREGERIKLNAEVLDHAKKMLEEMETVKREDSWIHAEVVALREDIRGDK